MADTFISYSIKDQGFVRLLLEAFARAGRDTWIDWRAIPDSSRWKAEIFAGIDAADNFLFVISPDSVSSGMCREEVAHASASCKRLITVVYRPVDPRDLPPPLAEVQWIPFHTTPFDEAFARVLKAIDTDLEWV